MATSELLVAQSRISGWKATLTKITAMSDNMFPWALILYFLVHWLEVWNAWIKKASANAHTPFLPISRSVSFLMTGSFQIVFTTWHPFCKVMDINSPSCWDTTALPLIFYKHTRQRKDTKWKITNRQPENVFKLNVKDPGIAPGWLDSRSISFTKRLH